MNTDEKRGILAGHLKEFRSWTYEALVAELHRTEKEHECLRHFEGVHTDGTEYQIEINVFWDDKSDGDIRVFASITVEPQRPLLGFLPIYISDATDSFIKSPDGSFVGE